MKTRIILASDLMGKTYAEEHYKNVYDFDKHIEGYMIDDEDCWDETQFPAFMEAWIDKIENGGYDVVTGGLSLDALSYLKDKGYNPELVVVASNPEVINELLRRKVIQNGFVHSDELAGLTNAVDLEYNMYGSMHEKVRVWYLNKPEYLSEVIKRTGTPLVRNDDGIEADSDAVVYYRGDCGEFLEYGV